MNSIEIVELHKRYKNSRDAIQELTLSIPYGTLFGLIGPNGAGKSTIINVLAGTVQRTAGRIFMLGREILRDDYQYKKEIGFVLDQAMFLEKLTTEEFLKFVGLLQGMSEREVIGRMNEILAFLSLEEKRNEWIDTLSAGMKKKVSLAAAIIHQPKLLILDEPLESIDPVSGKQIKEMLRQMANKGITVFLSSHNLETVESLCDEVAIINKGRLVFQSRTEDIRRKIKNEVSKETYQSLEEIFLDVVSGNGGEHSPRKLSWL